MNTNSEEPPPALFKYCTAAVGLRIIIESRVRFTPAEEFNDPFECLPVISQSAEDLDQRAMDKLEKEYASVCKKFNKPYNSEGYNEFIKDNFSTHRAHLDKTAASPQLSERMRTARDKHFGAFCLTESKENLIMWAHYADDHRGCVLAFDSHHAFFQQPEVRSLRRVTYGPQRARYVHGSRDAEYLSHKSIDWQAEAEWRMYGDFSTMESELNEKKETIYLTKLPPGVITAVYLGARMPASDSKNEDGSVRIGSETFERVAASAQVNIFKATTDAKRFALNFAPHPSG